MDKFLEIYNLPTLNQEEIDNLKRPVISNEIEFVLNQKKKFPANKSTQTTSQGNSTKHIKKN